MKQITKGFFPFALAAFLIGIIGGLSTVFAPAFMLDMNLAYSNTTWTALAQAVSTAACSPILGKLSDIFGRKKTLLMGLFIFTLGNVLSALSYHLFFLLVARFIVGVGTAAIAPTVLSYIITEFPPEQIAKGFSLYMLISSAAVIFGPSLGGIILSCSDWRMLMWISSIICVIFFFLCLIMLPKQSDKGKPLQDFDSTGAFFILIFFSLMLCVPAFGQNLGFTSAFFLLSVFFAALSLAGLIVTERKAKNPILIGRFMNRRAFILPVIILFLTQGLMQANMTNIIVFVNYTQPENTTISGYAISIMYFGMCLGSMLLGPLADKKEPKLILTLSLLLTGIGCGIMFLFSTATSFFLLASSLGILGLGLGANAAIFMKIVLSGLSAADAGAGTGIYGLFRDMAAPFGVAVFVPLFTNRIAALNHTPDAVVTSIHMLALMELACVTVGIIIVQFLPKIHQNQKGESI